MNYLFLNANFALKLQGKCWKADVGTFTAHLSVTIKRLTRSEQKVVLAAMLEGNSMPSNMAAECYVTITWKGFFTQFQVLLSSIEVNYRLMALKTYNKNWSGNLLLPPFGIVDGVLHNVDTSKFSIRTCWPRVQSDPFWLSFLHIFRKCKKQFSKDKRPSGSNKIIRRQTIKCIIPLPPSPFKLYLYGLVISSVSRRLELVMKHLPSFLTYYLKCVYCSRREGKTILSAAEEISSTSAFLHSSFL